MGYLSQRALVGMKHYQYKPAGYTYLDVIHTPMWNFLVELLPMWLAPNLVTLTGLSAVFAAYLINTVYLVNFSALMGSKPGVRKVPPLLASYLITDVMRFQ
eukprot:gene32530-17245_t